MVVRSLRRRHLWRRQVTRVLRGRLRQWARRPGQRHPRRARDRLRRLVHAVEAMDVALDRYAVCIVARLWLHCLSPQQTATRSASSPGCGRIDCLLNRPLRGLHRRQASLTDVSRVLLVTNDFPPRPGGIQSYLGEFVGRVAGAGPHSVTVYAPQWKGADAHDEAARAAGYRVVRHPGTLMLPGPAGDACMRRLIGEHGLDTGWFGRGAPLALLAPRARQAGASRVLASTHGHEVGWSMLPVARSVLRRIGDGTDVVTFVSRYTRSRFASAFGPA